MKNETNLAIEDLKKAQRAYMVAALNVHDALRNLCKSGFESNNLEEIETAVRGANYALEGFVKGLR